MELDEYTCESCGYSFSGCGGMGIGIFRDGFQTITCAQCKELRDLPLSSDLVMGYWMINESPPGLEQDRALADFASRNFVCPIEPWHTVHPWEHRGYPKFPGTVIAACPRCGGHMQAAGLHWIIE